MAPVTWMATRPSGRTSTTGTAIQAGGHFGVAGLGKVLVELPYRQERRRRGHADLLVGISADSGFPSRRCDGDREDHSCRAERPGDLAGRPGRRASGDAVIDDHRYPASEGLPLPAASVARCPASDLLPLALLRGGQLTRR